MSSPYFEPCTTMQLRLNSIPNALVFQGNLSQGVSYGAQPSARYLTLWKTRFKKRVGGFPESFDVDIGQWVEVPEAPHSCADISPLTFCLISASYPSILIHYWITSSQSALRSDNDFAVQRSRIALPYDLHFVMRKPFSCWVLLMKFFDISLASVLVTSLVRWLLWYFTCWASATYCLWRIVQARGELYTGRRISVLLTLLGGISLTECWPING